MGFVTERPFEEVESEDLLNLQKTAKMPKGGGLTAPMKVSPELAAIIGMKEASRAQCVKHLWAYLKEHNLQDPENKQFFTPDKKMAKVFGTERMRAFAMSKFLGNHLEKIEGAST